MFHFVCIWRALPPFKLQTVFWDLIVLLEQLVYSVMEEIHFSELVLLPNINILTFKFWV